MPLVKQLTEQYKVQNKRISRYLQKSSIGCTRLYITQNKNVIYYCSVKKLCSLTLCYVWVRHKNKVSIVWQTKGMVYAEQAWHGERQPLVRRPSRGSKWTATPLSQVWSGNRIVERSPPGSLNTTHGMVNISWQASPSWQLCWPQGSSDRHKKVCVEDRWGH